MASIHEIIKVEAHESEVLCIEYSSPDAGNKHQVFVTSFISVTEVLVTQTVVGACVFHLCD